MRLVIDLPDEVVKWFKGKGFIPIGQYLTVDEAMKKAEPLSEVLAEIKGEILDYNIRQRVSGSENFLLGYCAGMDKSAEIIDKHIGEKSTES